MNIKNFPIGRTAKTLMMISVLLVPAVASLKTKNADNDTSLFMQAKLVSSQKVMEGLVTEDFSLIRKGASDMYKLSEASHWPHSSDKVYEYLSKTFRDQCNSLANHAKRENLESAHHTYLQMTTTCIDCHNYVRGKFRIKKTPNDPRGPVQLIPTEWEEPRRKASKASQILRDRQN